MATDGALAVGHQLLIDKDTDRPGIKVVEEGGEQAQTGNVVVAPRSQHCQRAAQQGAADAEAQAVQMTLATDDPVVRRALITRPG